MSKKLIQAAAGAGGESVYVEDVFSTYLYGAEGTNPTIQTGIDMSEDGGMVWIKNRDAAEFPSIVDTERTDGSLASWLATSSTDVQSSGYSTGVSATFPTNGFTLSGTRDNLYNNSADFVSWNFKRQAGFFDVVTWTGDGSTTTHSHNLGSTPAVIIVKRTDSTSPWSMYHKDATDTVRTGADLMLYLNTTAAATYLGSTLWAATDSTFTTASGGNFNASGGTYVAYLFAHDDQSFGDNSDESIIKCGSFTTDGSGNATVNLGWEPQFFFHKRSDSTGSWYMYDVSRSWTAGDGAKYILYPNLSNAENQLSSNNNIQLTSTGFNVDLNANQTDIYIAIRRPMKTPTAGTEVFAIDTGDNDGGGVSHEAGFVTDLIIQNEVSAVRDKEVATRLTGSKYLELNRNNAEQTASPAYTWDNQIGVQFSYDSAIYGWMFKRATGFLDIVTYAGDGTTNQAISHNLGVVPEFIITKRRNSAYNWFCYTSVSGAGKYILLNSTGFETTNADIWDETSPTSTQFTVGNYMSNRSGDTYIAYLFATLDGVSKVGSYTGTGSSQNIDCGFSAGARFVLIKNNSEYAHWLLYDSTRGIVSGNDPYLFTSSDAAQVTTTDYIDPFNAGFTVNGSNVLVNASGDNYLFLAIA